MEGFSITNGVDLLKISIDEVISDSTSPLGGYEIKCLVDIQSDGFTAKGEHWTTTGFFYKLCTDLKLANEFLKGKVAFTDRERDLEFTLSYDDLGHVNVVGEYSKFGDNKLEFAFQTDQSFISATLHQLLVIVKKYGDQNGVRPN